LKWGPEDSYFCVIKIESLKKICVSPEARGLIFDLDGTIADTMPVHFTVYRDILKEYGVDFTPQLFDTLAGVPAVETFVKLNELFGLTLDAREMGRYKELEYEKKMHLIRPIEPVMEVIRSYYGRLPLSVGTGGYHRLAWKTLEIVGLDSMISILVSSENVTHHKPHPETFLKCAEMMGVEPRYCHVFEDGRLGIEAARTAGMMVTDVTEYYEVSIGK
jgi:beta-phosphoglucomutase-like phosphatase (HAD superfamily)